MCFNHSDKEKLYRLRAYVYQDLVCIKRVAQSCETEDQVLFVTDWVNSVVDKWISRQGTLKIGKKKNKEADAYIKEAISYIQEMVNSKTKQIRKTQGKDSSGKPVAPPKPVVKGFKST